MHSSAQNWCIQTIYVYSEHTRKTIPCHNCWVSGACTTTSCVCIHKSGEGEKKKKVQAKQYRMRKGLCLVSGLVSNARWYIYIWSLHRCHCCFLVLARLAGGRVCVCRATRPNYLLNASRVCMRQCCCVSVCSEKCRTSAAHRLDDRVQLCRVSWFSQNLITHSYLSAVPSISVHNAHK